MDFTRKYFSETAWGQLELELRVLSAREVVNMINGDAASNGLDFLDSLVQEAHLGGVQYPRFSDMPFDVVADEGQKIADFIVTPPKRES